MTRLVLAGLFIVVAVGCISKPINDKAESVQLVNEKPEGNCKEVGMASVTGVPPFFQNSMRTKLKNEAALLGGNYVKLEPSSANTLAGTVYSCP